MFLHDRQLKHKIMMAQKMVPSHDLSYMSNLISFPPPSMHISGSFSWNSSHFLLMSWSIKKNPLLSIVCLPNYDDPNQAQNVIFSDFLVSSLLWIFGLTTNFRCVILSNYLEVMITSDNRLLDRCFGKVKRLPYVISIMSFIFNDCLSVVTSMSPILT